MLYSTLDVSRVDTMPPKCKGVILYMHDNKTELRMNVNILLLSSTQPHSKGNAFNSPKIVRLTFKSQGTESGSVIRL
jgi:hypothetical protein